MTTYLIRHTTPAVSKGICYGQADLDLKESFLEEASKIRAYLPEKMDQVYSSPLIRCKKLARQLFAENPIIWEADLMEIHCGEWEMKSWDSISKEELDPWMNNFVHASIPGGESYSGLFERVVKKFNAIRSLQQISAIVTHGGVIRSILSHINEIPLVDSFKAFPLHFGCVVKLDLVGNRLVPQILYNAEPPEKEMHKPSSFYNRTD